MLLLAILSRNNGVRNHDRVLLDARALVKRYADEAGSIWIRQITDIEARHTIMLAEITYMHYYNDVLLQVPFHRPNRYKLSV